MKKPYCISGRAGKSGPPPPVRNQAQVEKYVAGSNPSPEYPSGFQYQEIPNDGPLYPSSPNNNSKAKRIKWTRYEFKGVMTTFYQAFNEGKGEGELVNIECILMPTNSLILGEILWRRKG